MFFRMGTLSLDKLLIRFNVENGVSSSVALTNPTASTFESAAKILTNSYLEKVSSSSSAYSPEKAHKILYYYPTYSANQVYTYSTPNNSHYPNSYHCFQFILWCQQTITYFFVSFYWNLLRSIGQNKISDIACAFLPSFI